MLRAAVRQVVLGRKAPLVVYESFSETSSASANSLNPGAPSGVVASDIVLMIYGGGFVSGNAITAPAGWTLVRRTDNSSIARAVYWAAGDVASYSFSDAGGASTRIAHCLRFSGAAATGLVSASQNGSGTTLTAPDITANAGSVLLAVWASVQSAAFGANPAGYTDISNVQTGTQRSAAAIRSNFAGGASGAVTRTKDNFSTSFAMHVGLFPS